MGHLQSKLAKKNPKPKTTAFKLKTFRHKRKVKRNTSNVSNKVSEFAPVNAFLHENNEDIDSRKRMQDQLAFDSDIFVLNQMLLSVQFFGHFER